MQYFLNDNVFGPYSGKQWGRKGDEVTVVSDHGNMVIVQNGPTRIAVKAENLSKKEVEKVHSSNDSTPVEKPAYTKPVAGKKQSTNQSNIQSLF